MRQQDGEGRARGYATNEARQATSGHHGDTDHQAR